MRVYINRTQYFEGVPTEVWNFYVGGYQVLHKWLKDRKGRESFDDLRHYSFIVSALLETIGTMKEVDEVIEESRGVAARVMPEFEMVSTVEEANAQTLDVPEYDGWFAFAHLLNGYDVADELGLELGTFSNEKSKLYGRTGMWEGTLLELRMVLFFEARALRMAGAPSYDPTNDPNYREHIRGLLGVIKQKAANEGRLAITDSL